jgi:hypothetical protein
LVPSAFWTALITVALLVYILAPVLLTKG